MERIIAVILSLVLGCVPAVCAQEASRWALDLEAGSVSFTLSSTLHDVTGSVSEYQGFLNLKPEAKNMEGQGVFSISSMKTGNGIRDRKMRQMFDADHFPQITYTFDRTIMPEEIEGATELRGRLTIRDVTQVHPISVMVKRDNDRIIISGETDISLNAFGLKAPGVMGMIRVKDVVRIKFEIVFIKQKDEA